MANEPDLAFAYQGFMPKLVCGRDVIASLPRELELLNARRAMVICGPNILKKSNAVARVQEALGNKYVGIFAEVEPHAPIEVVERAADVARGLNPDVFITVGGGSTHDTGKGIVTILGEGKDLRECLLRFEPPDKWIEPSLPNPKLPIIAVPTTFGCAEISNRGGFTDSQAKRKINKGTDDKSVPRVIVMDGLALATTPVHILYETGMGQLRVCIERVYSRQHNPLADALSLHGIRLLRECLPRCATGDINILLQAKVGGILPDLGPGGSGLNTAMGHQIGALFEVEHGIANSVTLPHTMRFNLEASADRQALIAQALGIDTSAMSDTEAGLAAADAVADLSTKLGLPLRLRDVGIPKEGLEAIAKATMFDRAIRSNPKPITSEEQVLEILKKAW